jgi:superkiller protein 3
LDEAVTSYSKAIELDPKNAKAYNNLGISLRKQKKLDEAIASYTKAIRINPRFVSAYRNLGLALRDQKKLDEAVAAYRKAIEIEPKHAGAHFSLGSILRDQRKVDEAIACFRKAIELDPKHVQSHIDLGAILCDVIGDYEGAIATFRKAIELDPKSATAHHNFGVARERQGRLDEAIDCYRNAIELNPKCAQAYNSLGTGLAKKAWDLVNPDPKLPDPKRALALGKEAVEVAPESVSVWQRVGWVRYQAGNWIGSIEALEKSCELEKGGDAGQWIVMSLAHAKLAVQEGVHEKVREQHKMEARRLYEQADKWIDSKWRVRPSHEVAQDIWDFRLEARNLIGVKEIKK